MKSKTRIRGIHSPYFYVSRTEGTPFGMHIEDFAAYSLNYLHMGAPKCWRVVAPKDNAKLEEIMHVFLNPEERMLSSRGDKKPMRPPQCSQFLRHKSVYVPEELLQDLNIGYTSVVQHQGEMVITFPFAYHQGYNTGPNIAEAIGYASDRWEVFIREGLYENCQKLRCKVEPIKMDLEFAKRPRGLRRSSERLRLHKQQPKTADVSPVAAYFDRQLRTRAQEQDPPPTAKPGVFPNIFSKRKLGDDSGKRTQSGVLNVTAEGQDDSWNNAQSSPEPPTSGKPAAKRNKVVPELENSSQLRSHLQGLDIESPDLLRRAVGDSMELDEDPINRSDHHHQEFKGSRRPSFQQPLQGGADTRTQTSRKDTIALVSGFTNDHFQRPSTAAPTSALTQPSPQPPITPSGQNDDEHYLTLLGRSRPPTYNSNASTIATANNAGRDVDANADLDADGESLYQSWTATDNPNETELLAAAANILKTHRGTSVAPRALQMPTPAGSSGNVSDHSPGGAMGPGESSREASVEMQRRARTRTQTPDYSTPWGYARSVRKR